MIVPTPEIATPIYSRTILKPRRPVAQAAPDHRPAIFTLAGVCAFIVLSVVYVSAHTLQAMRGQVRELRTGMESLEGRVHTLTESQSMSAHEQNLYLKIIMLRRSVNRDNAKTIARLVAKYSRAYQRDPDLVLALINTESGFDPKALTSVGAMGLTQVMPVWVKVFGVEGPLTDPETSIKTGLQVLNFYSAMFHENLKLALIAYNAGPGYVERCLRGKTKLDDAYAKKVLGYYRQLKTLNMEEE